MVVVQWGLKFIGKWKNKTGGMVIIDKIISSWKSSTVNMFILFLNFYMIIVEYKNEYTVKCVNR